MASTLNLSGRITDNGLLLPMDILRDFCRKNTGCRAVIRVTALSRDVTAAQRGYYFGYILPEIAAALAEQGTIAGEEQADEFLRSQCPICYRDGEVCSVFGLDAEDMSKYIDWLKWYAAENFHVFIEDSDTIV